MTNYSRELNKGLKIFSQLYVGFKTQGEGNVDLGFATPFENNAAFRKRKETVDKWSTWSEYVLDPNSKFGYKLDENGQYVIVNHASRTKVINNVPREGFKITDSVKRVYWGGGNVVWRIEDPLGFELEVQSQNLLAIIQNCDINTGVIKGKCLWARDGKDNILIHESSEEYKNALKAAETLKAPSTVPMAERVVGGKYLMKNGSEAIYMGRMYAYLPCIKRADALYKNYREDRAPAQFVKIPNITAKFSSGWANHGSGLVVTESQYSAGTVEQFDVVADNTLTAFTFYAKSGAPLVRRLDESVIDVPNQIQRLTHDTSMKFAGNRVGTIVYAQTDKFSTVKFGTRKPSAFEKQIMLQMLDKIQAGREYNGYGNAKQIGEYAFRHINNIGDGFEFGGQQYQHFLVADIDERFATYTGPNYLLLKTRITEDVLRISKMYNLEVFSNMNYLIGRSGPISHTEAGIDIIEGKTFESISDLINMMKERIDTNRVYVIHYKTEA